VAFHEGQLQPTPCGDDPGTAVRRCRHSDLDQLLDLGGGMDRLRAAACGQRGHIRDGPTLLRVRTCLLGHRGLRSLVRAFRWAVDAALNAYAARHFGARQVNLMHAAYGIGAATSPSIVTAVIGMGRSWRWAYITVMAIQALLAALFAGTSRRSSDASAEPAALATASTEDQSPGRPRWWRRAPAVGGLLVIAVQTGLESVIGLWAFVYLLSAVALPAATAGVIVSSYWAAIVLGRILLGALAQRIGIWPVLGTLTTVAVTASALLLTRQPVLAAGGIILLGLALAPVYPLLVLTTAERTTADATDRLVGLQAAVSTIGAVVFPTAVGLIMGVNPMAFASCVVVLALIDSGGLWTLRPGRRQ
jgi:fucose permease